MGIFLYSNLGGGIFLLLLKVGFIVRGLFLGLTNVYDDIRIVRGYQ